VILGGLIHKTELKMPRYVLLLGSNVEPEATLDRARALLERRYGILRSGTLVTSPDRDAGASVPPYLNCAAEIASPNGAAALKAELREIEAECGRVRPAPIPGLCPMDIDIALCFANGHWQVVDHKAVSTDYASLALATWRYSDTQPLAEVGPISSSFDSIERPDRAP
jgi:2-amino-4-hydroxy-6-hydroxymethyldihydropteridine diphosphokinase